MVCVLVRLIRVRISDFSLPRAWLLRHFLFVLGLFMLLASIGDVCPLSLSLYAYELVLVECPHEWVS